MFDLFTYDADVKRLIPVPLMGSLPLLPVSVLRYQMVALCLDILDSSSLYRFLVFHFQKCIFLKTFFLYVTV